MRPEDRQLQSGDPRGHIQPPSRGQNSQAESAANIVRGSIDSIYSDQHGAPSTETGNELPTAYKRSHDNAHTVHAAQWKQYHSAWQDYYQKYYEHYYVGALKQVHEAYNEHAVKLTENAQSTATSDQSISQQEAMDDLRGKLLGRVRAAGAKTRRSKHFVPITAALVVLLVFSFLQYNRAIFASVSAYVTPGEIDPQNIPTDPYTDTKVGPEPLLIIPKINVNVPVNYDVQPDQASQLKAMENGVAWFGINGANSKPGQVGNTVISGHSSNDFIEGGNYKFVFALLDRLKEGDTFYLNYQGTRYTYNVTGTKVVKPTDVESLVYPTDKPMVTLITCTPLGTALNRLLVTAVQVNPSPSNASAAPATSGSSNQNAIPGNSPTFLEKVFGN